MNNCVKCDKRAKLKCQSCGREWCYECHERDGKPGLFAGKCGICDGIMVRKTTD